MVQFEEESTKLMTINEYFRRINWAKQQQSVKL